MAKRAGLRRQAKKTKNVYSAQRLNLNLLEIFKGVLVFVGKPFYFLLSRAVVAILFLLFVIGRAVRVILTSPFKISLPRITVRPLPLLSKVGILFRLLLLKTRLLIEIFFGLLRQIKIPARPKGLLFRNFVMILLIVTGGVIFWAEVIRDLPSPKQLVERQIDVSTKIYDRNGVLLYKIFKDKNRTVVPLAQIPLNVRLATLAAEDAEFYSHPGISIRGILRAMINNFQKGELTGGSTITQQLVKNALLSSEKTYVRKIREAILSVEVELTFSKDQILEMYLNEVSYGGTAYGIQEASQEYFGKNVQDLTLSEAALLAGLPKSPTKYSPFGANPDLAKARQEEVVHLMRVNKFITTDQENASINEKVVLAPNKTQILAPHFVMYVRQQLVDKYGEEVTQKGGLEVTTTLDYGIQKLTQETVSNEVNKLRNLNVGNGAAVVLDPRTGQILAMVGSQDYFNTAQDGNVNVTLRPRQPGSSIKVVNYAYALSHGYTAASILDDSPVIFSIPGQPAYSPKDYDGNFRGKISLRSALAESRNIPAVKVLASYGVDKMIEMGRKMGITSWEDSTRYGLSLTLGGGEVKLIDLAQVYATIADYGKKPNINSILEVKNYKGIVLEKNTCQRSDAMIISAAEASERNCNGEQVVDSRVAFLLIDILHDNNARTPAFGSNSALVVPEHPEVAVKTGTSNDLKDNLTVGFNQKYLVATWVGNNDSTPMARIASGVTGASPIWNKIMEGLLAQEPSQAWEVPNGVIPTAICTFTGSLPCEGCPTRNEWFLEESVPKKACSPEQIRKTISEKKPSGSPPPQGPGQILEPAINTF